MNKDKMGDAKRQDPLLVDKEQLVTANLAEVTYLMKQHHKLTDVSLAMGTMGAEEVLFTMEGENIIVDRKLFLGNCRTPLKQVPEALEAIRNLLWKKEDEEVEA